MNLLGEVAAPQGAAEWGKFLERGGETAAQRANVATKDLG